MGSRERSQHILLAHIKISDGAEILAHSVALRRWRQNLSELSCSQLETLYIRNCPARDMT